MARIVFNAEECDQQFQIEDGIRKTLETAPVASTLRTTIETCYELENDSGTTIDGSVNDKCQQIADRLNVDFSLTDDLIIFRPKRRTGCAPSGANASD